MKIALYILVGTLVIELAFMLVAFAWTILIEEFLIDS